MSWSIGYTGTKEQVLAELRKQIHANDSQAGAPEAMSNTENALRRMAQSLLFMAVSAHNVPEGAQSKSYIGTMTKIRAEAWGSECRDGETGESYNDLGITVMTSAAEPAKVEGAPSGA